MQTVADRPEAPTAIRTDLDAIFVSLELSRSTWLITSLSPEKMSKQVVRGGDVAELLERFARLREKARARTGKVFPFVVIQEAGLDGFWIDRALQNEGIESHVVDPASIATSRRRRRAKTDGIDGEALARLGQRLRPRRCSARRRKFARCIDHHDARRKRRLSCIGVLSVQLGERPPDRERRPHCALGVVLLRHRMAEQRHQPVADQPASRAERGGGAARA